MRRGRHDQRGVSEVIGTILILLITVIMFSVIILWVTSLPSPSEGAATGFDGSLAPNYEGGLWDGASINLTHVGGEDLVNRSTRIYLTINNNFEVLRTQGTFFDGVSVKPYGIDGHDDTWHIGEVWSYLNESIPQGANITVMVVNLDRGVVLWQEDLSGIDGEDAPVFIDKWLDSDTSTATRDPVTPGATFAIYTRVIDPDDDLNPASVWAYLTFGAGGVPFGYVQLMDDGTAGDRVASDGVFSRSLSYAAQPGWDGGIVILNATDDGGRETETRLILRVVNFGGNQIMVGPQNLTFGSDAQRYDIFEESDWDTNQWLASSTRTFEKGETVVVVVASQYLPNLEVRNDFMLYDPSVLPVDPIVYGPPPYNDPVGPTTRPSSTKAFAFIGFTTGFYTYEYRFPTDSSALGFDGVQLAYGQYTLSFDLRPANVPLPLGHFSTVDAITVTDAMAGAPDYPRIQFFKDAAHTQESNTFLFTERMYVKVTVADTDISVSASDVIIFDFLGRVQIWGTPGTWPITALAVNDSTSYAFSIDLSSPNFDPWNFDEWSYGFRIKRLSDANELYGLSTQVIIQGPRWQLDVVAAFNDFSPEPCTYWYSTFYENNGFWTRTVLEEYVEPADIEGQCKEGGGLPAWHGDFLDVALGDIDEDGDLDAVFGLLKGYVFWYRNVDGNGRVWERYQFDSIGVGQVLTVDVGHADLDTDEDVVVGTSTNQIFYYSNDGVWTRTLVDTITCDFTSIKFADITADGFNDVVAGTGGPCDQVRIYENDGLGNFAFIGAFAVGTAVNELTVADVNRDRFLDIVLTRGNQGRIYWGPDYSSYQTLPGLSAVLTIDVGYIDADATLDVVIGTVADNIFWFANDGTWSRTLIANAGSDIEDLRVGDVDGDFWDDIVFGLRDGSVLWLRHVLGAAWVAEYVEQWVDPIDPGDLVPPRIRAVDIGDVDRGVVVNAAEYGS